MRRHFNFSVAVFARKKTLTFSLLLSCQTTPPPRSHHTPTTTTTTSQTTTNKMTTGSHQSCGARVAPHGTIASPAAGPGDVWTFDGWARPVLGRARVLATTFCQQTGASIASKLITLRDAVFSLSSTFFIIIPFFLAGFLVYGWHFQAVDYGQKALAAT